MQASELADLALSKLEFLEVTKKGLSKLQILLVELEVSQYVKCRIRGQSVCRVYFVSILIMLNNNLPSKGTLGIEKQPLKNAT